MVTAGNWPWWLMTSGASPFSIRATDDNDTCMLLLEATIVLGTGSLAGLVAGSVSHRLLARWLADTTGYPAPFALSATQIAVVLAGIVGAALALIALASASAARVEQRMAFHE